MSTKVNLPINWTKVLWMSALIALISLVLGALTHIRALLALADLLIIGTLVLALGIVAVAVIKLFTSPLK